MSVLTNTLNDPRYAMQLKHPALGLLLLIHIYAMEINKIISISDYAQSVTASSCNLITNGPNGNWLSFLNRENEQIATLPIGKGSQDCKDIMKFNILCFADGGQVATANSYVVASSVNFA